jgi:hypothetical protein
MEVETGKRQRAESEAQLTVRRAELEALEGALADLGALDTNVEDEDIEGLDASVDAALEEEIAARRRAIEEHACPSCGAAFGEGDRFCRLCGAQVETVGTG